ncbi:MerR family transcriptional regulator [Helicobacter aurati]|uniref:MerR family transcriptional regulator n=1 Tax=Helicobacter aurati TaxID=137778 RepID=A0A3D8J1F7_9HELI|nr:MerR family transcriptional regulator [Helicobacter aurati]RDU71060.1 MerR family transcriptional regulator [Helicobacter aurati]
MAYTIIEVERKTGVASRKIRFWLDKGLFPFVERDINGVRYFSESDIEWVIWVNCYRNIGMSIKKLRQYIYLCSLGSKTLSERLAIINEQKQKTLQDLENLQEILKKLNYKIEYYNTLIAENKGEISPMSKDYKAMKNLKAQCKK